MSLEQLQPFQVDPDRVSPQEIGRLVDKISINSVDPDCVQGLLIIGQDREFFSNRRKQERKRDMNQNSQIKVRTYGAFLRKFGNQKSQGWLTAKIKHILDRSKVS